jgi:putative SOS response-associated peptidase YedK
MCNLYSVATNREAMRRITKAMPVLLRTEEEQQAWLTAQWSEAKALQRPLPDGQLEIVHRTPLKYLPGVDGIPSGDPLRVGSASREPSLF